MKEKEEKKKKINMHMPCSYGSAGVPNKGYIGAFIGGQITTRDLIIFMKIIINSVNLESYRIHLIGLISYE